MATFNFLSDLDWNSYEDIAGGEVTLRGALVFRYVSANGFVITVKGEGFVYDAQGIPIGGTIREMQIFSNGVHYVAYTGLATALAMFNTLVLGTTSGSGMVEDPQMEAAYAELRHGNDLLRTSELGKDISGYAGNDTIFGNGGDDWLSGGQGVDRLFGGAGVDGVYFSDPAATQGVSVDMRKAAGNILNDGFGNVETATAVEKYEGGRFGDLLIGAGRGDYFWGLAGNDTLTGNAGDDDIFGGDGFDRLTGGVGDDLLEGGRGKDVIYGGAGWDVLAFWDVAAPGHGVHVDLRRSVDQVLDDGYGFSETATGIEAVGGSDLGDTLYGNALDNELGGNGGDDSLYGLFGDDLLFGGDGNDRMFGGDGINEFHGGAGRDTMVGGDDEDRFIYDEASANNIMGADVITADGQHDSLWFPDSWSTSLFGGGLRNGQFEFVDGVVAETPETRFFFSRSQFAIYFDSNGSGIAPAIKIADFHGVVTSYLIHIYDS